MRPLPKHFDPIAIGNEIAALEAEAQSEFASRSAKIAAILWQVKQDHPEHLDEVCRIAGRRCWELDAMNPIDLRNSVKRAIVKLVDPVAWERCEVVNKAEQESMRTILGKWGTKR